MNFRRWPRTDVGTVLLHWVTVAAIVVLMQTGLRFTSDDVHYLWLRDFDAYLGSETLWERHLIAAGVLTLAAVAYALYMSKARLWDRIRLNGARLQGLFGTAKMCWSCINVLLYWAFFIAVLGACATGWLAYYDLGGPLLPLHRLCTWVILAFPVLHLLALLRLAGVPHLLRIFRPKRVEPAADEIDLAHIVSDLLAEKRAAERRARSGASASANPAAKPRQSP
ncbi:cytochrome b/b6 domain-containing protein [Phaeovulum sp. W22_SRMD_FR3]|uniref:cytochrome b/b6 domain-containing protein n=1 Tax=Phaeovulum sp. W22_SRMD_FR3 TaxID=3240274 RepID=UPI003F9BAF32